MSVNLIESTGKLAEIQSVSAKVSSAGQSVKTQEEPLQQRFDSYEPQPPAQSAGLYEVGVDELGNRMIKFDNPEKDTAAEEKRSNPREDEAGEDGEPALTEVTVSTDKVDREIEKLKQAERELKRQITSADPEETKALEAKLSQIEAELKIKDNDAYRRQHMEVSEGGHR